MKQKVLTNEPFTANCTKILAYIPEGITVTVNYSADGAHYDEIGEEITGPETLQINEAKPTAYLKFVSTSEAEIAVIN